MVGFIASVSRPFCLNCNRLRLTADGKLRYCLFAIEEDDVKTLMRSGASDEEIAARVSAYQPPARPHPGVALSKYAKLVSSASAGAIAQ